MQELLYRILLKGYKAGITVASVFNPKAKLFVKGREDWREHMQILQYKGSPRVWMHCASLGEYEQGRTLLEAIQNEYPDYETILTFFSPSGYEVKKDKNIADHIFYLPIDSPTNAQDFISIVQPDLCIFVKYEFWLYYLSEIKRRSLKSILISAIFRESQPFFKPYGGLHRKMLKSFSHIFVQDENSEKLLSGIGINNITVAGDTRFDRVSQLQENKDYKPFFEHFCGQKKILIAGSTWPDDEKLLHEAIQHLNDWKLILFPHEVNNTRISNIMSRFGDDTVKLSEYTPDSKALTKKVLVVDSIGLLGSSYRYGRVAYIGGGFNKSGIHNILEAAVYGMPIVHGPEYQKSREARELIKEGGACEVKRTEDILHYLSTWEENENLYEKAAEVASAYVKENAGATDLIMNYLSEKKLLIRS